MMTMIVVVLTVMLGLITVSSSSSGSSASSTSSTSAPRMKLTYKELQQFNGVKRFDLDRSCCFGSLLLDEERGRLFVGARNYLLSLSLDNIAKQEQKIYWPAPVEWREECNWAGKDINVRFYQSQHIAFSIPKHMSISTILMNWISIRSDPLRYFIL
ncbi:semaphorin-3B [Tachysurus ichikawai]